MHTYVTIYHQELIIGGLLLLLILDIIDQLNDALNLFTHVCKYYVLNFSSGILSHLYGLRSFVAVIYKYVFYLYYRQVQNLIAFEIFSLDVGN